MAKHSPKKSANYLLFCRKEVELCLYFTHSLPVSHEGTTAGESLGATALLGGSAADGSVRADRKAEANLICSVPQLSPFVSLLAEREVWGVVCRRRRASHARTHTVCVGGKKKRTDNLVQVTEQHSQRFNQS